MIRITLPSAEHLDFVKAVMSRVQVPFQHARIAVEVAEALDNAEPVRDAALDAMTDR